MFLTIINVIFLFSFSFFFYRGICLEESSIIYLYVCEIIFLTIVGVIPVVIYFLLWDLFRGI